MPPDADPEKSPPSRYPHLATDLAAAFFALLAVGGALADQWLFAGLVAVLVLPAAFGRRLRRFRNKTQVQGPGGTPSILSETELELEDPAAERSDAGSE